MALAALAPSLTHLSLSLSLSLPLSLSLSLSLSPPLHQNEFINDQLLIKAAEPPSHRKRIITYKY